MALLTLFVGMMSLEVATTQKRVRVPPSKSVTHRALVLTLLGGRPIEIERPLRSTDTDVMLGALVAVGWRVDPSSVGLRLVPPTAAVVEASIDCGRFFQKTSERPSFSRSISCRST